MSALRSMASALGGDVAGASVLCPGPGHSDHDRSMSVTLSAADRDGFVVYSHAGDDWRTCRDHVLVRLGRLPARAETPRKSSAAIARNDRSEAAAALWKAAVDPRGTVVEKYLAARGLELPDEIACRIARYHDACPWRAEDGLIARRPAMLTAFRSISDDRLVAVHRTLLSDSGQKIDRRMLGPVGGAAIKIDSDETVEQGLSICEGFETGLAGRELGFRPVWALGSAGAIAAFPVVSGVDALTILAETDDSGANARAVRACRARWSSADREVIVATPRVAGDMNDALRS
jgi:putative DNA primase/helicase